MNPLWSFLEGKKTYIGLTVTSVSLLAPVWGPALHLSPSFVSAVQTYCAPGGLVMGFIGRYLAKP